MNAKNSIIALFSIMAVVVIGLGLSACGGSTNPDSNDTTKTDTTDVVPADVAVSKIKLYFDNSESMAGYVNSQAFYNSKTLINAVNGIAQDYGNGKSFSAELCCVEKGQKAVRSGIKFDELNTMIQKGTIASGSESLLDKIMGKIANEAKAHPDELCVLFTDGIISGPSAEIRKNPEYTPNNIEILKSNLRNALKGKGLGASIFRFNKAGYNGQYWYYDNWHEMRPNTKTRPIYVVVIGSPKAVVDFKDWVEGKSASNFKPDSFAHITEKLPVEKGLTSKHGIRDGKIMLKQADLNKKDNGILTIKLPYAVLNGLFDSKFDKKTLKPRVSIDGIALEGSVQGKDGNDYDVVVAAGEAFEINVPGQRINKSNSKVKVEIPYAAPKWISTYSTDNDKTKYDDNTTYMLKKFCEAIIEGISGEMPDNIFEQTVEVEKK